ncbi:MAG: type II secretion system protein [Patescibacteria group bacterium]|nr:type II secretion system protein [Patescibacteria group bacterium]
MNSRKAFTLVELIVVITLIGIISTMSIIFFN